MGKTIDLTRERFSRLLVVEKTDKRYVNGDVIWACVCDCGEKCEIPSTALRSGRTKSCGCFNKEIAKEKGVNSAIDLLNKRFGKLIVIEKTDERNGTFVIWKCRCDCGNVVNVKSGLLILGKTQSCGCAKVDNGRNMIANASQNLGLVSDTCVAKISSKTIASNNTTGVRGVFFDKKRNKYRSCITFQKKTYELGRYEKLEDAKQIREKAEEKLFGEFLEWYYETYPEKKKDKEK